MTESGRIVGLARPMRPYAGFTADYQGQPSRREILFHPVDSSGNAVRFDPLAGQNGYKSGAGLLLANFMPVPYGSEVYLWLPRLRYWETKACGHLVDASSVGYSWCIIWRMRSLFDYTMGRRGAYHLPFQNPITNNNVDTKSGVVIPTVSAIVPYGYEGVVYEQTEVTTSPFQNQHYQMVEAIGEGPHPDNSGPLGPVGVSLGSSANQLPFLLKRVRANGDELGVGLFRNDTSKGVWDFDEGDCPAVSPGQDSTLGEFLASPTFSNCVYVVIGGS